MAAQPFAAAPYVADAETEAVGITDSEGIHVEVCPFNDQPQVERAFREGDAPGRLDERQDVLHGIARLREMRPVLHFQAGVDQVLLVVIIQYDRVFHGVEERVVFQPADRPDGDVALLQDAGAVVGGVGDDGTALVHGGEAKVRLIEAAPDLPRVERRVVIADREVVGRRIRLPDLLLTAAGDQLEEEERH